MEKVIVMLIKSSSKLQLISIEGQTDKLTDRDRQIDRKHTNTRGCECED